MSEQKPYSNFAVWRKNVVFHFWLKVAPIKIWLTTLVGSECGHMGADERMERWKYWTIILLLYGAVVFLAYKLWEIS